MKTNLKTAFLAGAASVLMLTGCNQSTDQPVSRSADDDAAYRTARDNERRDWQDPSIVDRDERDLPGTFAIPREDLNDKRLSDARITGDAQVLGMLTAIDKHEMHASGEAIARELSAPVKEFSEMLHKDHGESLEKTNQIIKNLDLTLSIPDKGETLLNDGKTKVTDMARHKGAEFERVYMLAMVQGHIDALRVIDDELLPAAKSAEVTSHLKSARERIAEHLKQAQKIHGDLSKPYPDTTPPTVPQ